MACQRLEPQISHSLILRNSMLIQTSRMRALVHAGALTRSHPAAQPAPLPPPTRRRAPVFNLCGKMISGRLSLTRAQRKQRSFPCQSKQSVNPRKLLSFYYYYDHEGDASYEINAVEHGGVNIHEAHDKCSLVHILTCTHK